MKVCVLVTLCLRHANMLQIDEKVINDLKHVGVKANQGNI
jgi:hypothetical protein